jgi:selenocysteine lyase/cysteine desulfurase
MNRDRFPALVAADVQGRVLVDNAAGAQLPDVAIERMQRFLAYGNAPKGGVFPRAQATTDLVAEAKAAFAGLIAQPVERVGVGLNATSTAVAFSRLVAGAVRPGDRIVVTDADHAGNVEPWTWLRRFGAEIDAIPVDAQGDLDRDALRDALARRPLLVALPWCSNATGTRFDVAVHACAAKAAGALVVVDGVQALPHFPVEIEPAFDLVVFSAYKVYAPHVGFWYVSGEAEDRFVRPDDAIVAGGSARNWTLETGTQSHEALAGWLGTMAYLRDVAPSPRAAMAAIASHERELGAYARAKFAERSPRVTLYGRGAEHERLPLFAFNVAGVAPDDLAARFARANVEARVGDFYSASLMRAVAGAAGARAVRISLAHYNTAADIDRCFDVVDAALDRFAAVASR